MCYLLLLDDRILSSGVDTSRASIGGAEPGRQLIYDSASDFTLPRVQVGPGGVGSSSDVSRGNHHSRNDRRQMPGRGVSLLGESYLSS